MIICGPDPASPRARRAIRQSSTHDNKYLNSQFVKKPNEPLLGCKGVKNKADHNGLDRYQRRMEPKGIGWAFPVCSFHMAVGASWRMAHFIH
jgi:hypothetical protein